MSEKPLTNIDLLGIHRGISNADYHAGEGLSKSDLDLLAISPAHYKEKKEHPDSQTEAMTIGSAFHTYVLEPDKFWEQYAVKPKLDMRTKVGKEAMKAWQAENENKIALDGDVVFTIKNMRESFMKNPIIKKLIEDTEHELSAYAELNGTLCKARPDGWSEENNIIIDLKSTIDASLDGFRRAVSRGRYHVQDAWYAMIMEGITDEPLEAFYFFACEKTPPYACAIYELDAETIQRGEDLAMRDLARYQNAMAKSKWPAYPMTIQELRLSNWELSQTVNY